MAAQARPHREEIQFAPNVPVTVSLKFAQPKLISGMSGERYLFTTTDDRVFFLDPPIAGQIAELGINVRESFVLEKQWNGQRDTPATWRVERAVGQQPNGTLVVPKPPASAPAGEARRGARLAHQWIHSAPSVVECRLVE